MQVISTIGTFLQFEYRHHTHHLLHIQSNCGEFHIFVACSKNEIVFVPVTDKCKELIATDDILREMWQLQQMLQSPFNLPQNNITGEKYVTSRKKHIITKLL